MKPFVSLLLTFICLTAYRAKAQQTKDPATIVQEWNTANNKQDIGLLIYYYDSEVQFYGSKLKKQDCIAGKLSIFKKYPGLTQEISGKIAAVTLENGDVKCSFDKAVNINGTVKTYAAYLVFRNGKIIAESDLTTDANLEKRRLIKKGAVKCEVDGDGKPEYVYLVPPVMDTSEDDYSCVGDSCTSFIRFSNTAIPQIRIPQCIGGTPDNLGDLDGDGRDEIGLYPQWFTSCWAPYYVYTFKNGQWKELVPTISTNCQLWEEGKFPIAKDPDKPGYVIIHYSQFEADDIVTKTKSVKVK